MRKWTVCYDVHDELDNSIEAHIEITVPAKSINEAIEKARQYYAVDKLLRLTDVTSYEI